MDILIGILDLLSDIAIYSSFSSNSNRNSSYSKSQQKERIKNRTKLVHGQRLAVLTILYGLAYCDDNFIDEDERKMIDKVVRNKDAELNISYAEMKRIKEVSKDINESVIFLLKNGVNDITIKNLVNYMKDEIVKHDIKLNRYLEYLDSFTELYK